VSPNEKKKRKFPLLVPVIRRRSEDGDTLIEVLLALVVLSLATVALLVGFATVISASAEHRTLSNDNLALEAGAQQLTGLIEASTNPNLLGDSCSNSGSASYSSASYPGYNSGAGLSVSEGGNSYQVIYALTPYTAIQYWNGSSYATTCTAASNGAPQLITIQLVGTNKVLTFVVGNPSSTSSSTSGSGTESLVIANYSQSATQSSPNLVGSAGAYLSPQPYVEVVDPGSNAISTDLSPILLSITKVTGTGTLSGCSGLEVNGFVTFSECSISAQGIYEIQATDQNSNIAASPQYYISVSAAGYSLSFNRPSATSGACTLSGSAGQGQPVGGVSGAQLNPQPAAQLAVWVENSSLQQVCGWTGTIVLASSGGILSNDSANGSTCLSLSATNGFAQPAGGGCDFAGGYVLVSQGGYQSTNYVLTASVPNPPTSTLVSSTTSSPFHVSSYGAAVKLVYYLQPIGVASASASTAFVSQSFSIPFLTSGTAQAIVAVEDSFGNIVVNAKNGTNTMGLSTFSLTGGGGTLSGCTPTLNSGYYLITGCHGTAYAGSVTLTATSSISVTVNGTSSTPSVTSSAFGITGVPNSLIFSTQPVAGASGSIFTTMPVLEVLDSGNRVVSAATGGTLALTASGGILSNCTNLTLVSGVVSAQNCTFAGLESGSYTLNGSITVTVGGTSYPLTATSGSFAPPLPGAATQLVFVTSPTAGAAGSTLSTMPVVYVEDSAGNLITSSNIIISLTPSGGTLANCGNLAVTGGVANVTGCTFGGLIGTPYTLTASATGLTSGTSSSFMVTGPGPVNQLVLNLSVSGSSCSPSIVYLGTCTPTATFEDAYGNTETTDAATISFQNSGSNGGTVSAVGPSEANGVASETLTGTALGTISVYATGGGLTTTTGTFTVAKAAQTVNFYTSNSYATTTTTGNATYSAGGTYQTYAQGSAGGTVTFASTTTGVCTVNSTSGLVTFVTGGSCVVTADAATTTNYLDSGTTTFTLTINKANQTIVFTAPTRASENSANYTPSGTSSSGLPVTFTLDGTSTGCTLTAGVVDFTAVGTCVIDANQAGNASYNAATQVQRSITVVNLGFTSLATAGALANTATTASITGTAGSKIVIFVSFTSQYGGNTCGTPTSTAFTGATQIGTTYGFYAGNPYDYLCVYTATATGTAGTVTETDTGSASSGHSPSTDIQVMGITGDNSAVVTNSATSAGTTTAVTFNLGTTPGAESLEMDFGAAQFTQNGTQPTFSTPTNFTLLSIQPAAGYPSVVGYVFYGDAATPVTDTLSATDNWGSIGLEIQP
jgi:hypothetical protein